MADPPAVVSAVPLQLTFVPGELVPASGVFAAWGPEDLTTALLDLDLPAGEPGTAPIAIRERGAPVRLLPLLAAVRRLAAMPAASAWPGWQRPADSILGYAVAAKLALEVVTAGRLLPMVGAGSTPETALGYWRSLPPQDGRLAQLAAVLPPSAHAITRADGSVYGADELLITFLDAVADACGRRGHRPAIGRVRGQSKRPWVELWPAGLTGTDPTLAPLRVPSDELEAEVEDWAAPALGRRSRGTARLSLRVVPPPTPEDERLVAVDESWHVDLQLQSLVDQDETISAAALWSSPSVELGGRRVHDAADTFVRGLAEAARVFEPLTKALNEARPERVELNSSEAADLMTEGISELTGIGIGVQLPPELRELNTRRLRARIRIGETTGTAGRLVRSGALAREEIANYRYEIALGDDALTDEEFTEIVSLKRSLVRWRGEWVRIDHEDADRMAELSGATGSLELTEALAAALAGHADMAADDLDDVEVVADGDVEELVERLRVGGRPGDARIVAIEGELRPYQQRGVAWMQQMADLGVGGVLADEMGLGKTIMAIALLTSRPQDRPHLVVCPTSVVGNWQRELNRFAPKMPVIRHHGPERPTSPRQFPPSHVVLTSYALLRRDVGLLSQVDWDIVAFDEAQQVKNAASKGAKAARAMVARSRFALTGTPIENRLAELWAILDVTNPGLLGSQRRFNERYAVPIERWRDEAAAERLRRLIAPFVMRRRKSDPEVSVDLPPKQEITVACSLTREQASLYQAAIDKAFSVGLGSTAFERRGRILALLTALKQICNHPRQYLSDDGRLTGRSGKLSRTTDILGEITANGDYALVFTQFRAMGELLAQHLGDELDLPEVPFLHGGTPLTKREEMVDRFQDDPDAPPILLVSLRAGGTGLNLTRATEVIHFDRWWNPAVEDQATDRVHRIGQTRAVTVHRLVTSGTIEERIADLLERKRSLADAVVGEGESWITDLDDDELRELVALSSDDIEDDEDDAA